MSGYRDAVRSEQAAVFAAHLAKLAGAEAEERHLFVPVHWKAPP
jgi:hypothetical protein